MEFISKLCHHFSPRAEREAHTWAGGFGTFCFTKGSQLARKIERLFQADFTQKEVKELRKMVVALRQEIEELVEIACVF